MYQPWPAPLNVEKLFPVSISSEPSIDSRMLPCLLYRDDLARNIPEVSVAWSSGALRSCDPPGSNGSVVRSESDDTRCAADHGCPDSHVPPVCMYQILHACVACILYQLYFLTKINTYSCCMHVLRSTCAAVVTNLVTGLKPE
jgi:hypothetical protein